MLCQNGAVATALPESFFHGAPADFRKRPGTEPASEFSVRPAGHCEASHDLSRVLPTASLAAGSPFGVRTASPPYSLSSAVTLPQQ